MNNSIDIILNKYKEDHITKEEAIKLIEDLYGNRINYVPTYPIYPYYYKLNEVTCTHDFTKMS